jgi:HD-GYP domain-containing protein (c-di-GMP phosphodiesterase class II)
MDIKLDISLVKVGMYVSSLDRPWIDTPFLLEGFLIQEEDEITLLNEYCSYVYVDPDRGIVDLSYNDSAVKLKSNQYLERFLRDGKKRVEYKDTKTVKEELPVATEAFEKASAQVANIMDSIRDGENLKLEDIKGVVEPILESIVRNAEAYMLLSMMHKKNKYAYTHSVDNCALAVAFGRYMGLPKKELKSLAIGLLMMDMGNIRIPQPILNKSGKLTKGEYSVIKKHVGHSIDILKSIDGMNEDIINIALTHHERFDGSGYPNGLFSTQIPVYGRMAAIIDCYDAMTSNRPFSSAKSPYSALQNIYNWRGSAFQPELVEQFLQCMGAYPTGTIIEMTDGKVGIVLSQNPTQRMRPVIMLLLDEDKKQLREYKTIDLKNQYEDSSGESLNIRCGLDPGEYGIDPTEYYL